MTRTHALHLKGNTKRLHLVRNTSRHVKNKPLTVTLALTFGERTEARHVHSTHSCAVMSSTWSLKPARNSGVALDFILYLLDYIYLEYNLNTISLSRPNKNQISLSHFAKVITQHVQSVWHEQKREAAADTHSALVWNRPNQSINLLQLTYFFLFV